ncbi:hypothetical protein [Clostridium hydrogeniformans]|uniref:hypothetical protein n=1 Tax=Clostridium hydrogeniformans TaxID=349933 RepID=UPI00068C2360|nr:hypothetical protein [Clostridium hydrogeniformans]
MKKKDILWGFSLILIIFFLVYPSTHEIFVGATKSYPYITGFVKVSLLATMGELLAIRIKDGDFIKPKGLILKSIVWGFIGVVFVIMFDLFSSGVLSAKSKGLLPTLSNSTLDRFVTAFFTSALMNLTFAPTFMSFHRVTDTCIDLGTTNLNRVLKSIDWSGFISFVVIKTIPLFWIPAHTLTFMLPGEYRVLSASFLSIALGAILALAKRPVANSNSNSNSNSKSL